MKEITKVRIPSDICEEVFKNADDIVKEFKETGKVKTVS